MSIDPLQSFNVFYFFLTILFPNYFHPYFSDNRRWYRGQKLFHVPFLIYKVFVNETFTRNLVQEPTESYLTFMEKRLRNIDK